MIFFARHTFEDCGGPLVSPVVLHLAVDSADVLVCGKCFALVGATREEHAHAEQAEASYQEALALFPRLARTAKLGEQLDLLARLASGRPDASSGKARAC